MDVEPLLLRAVHANPGDGVAWQALADSLEERGQSGPAELLRLRLALTEAPDVHFWEYNSRDPVGKPVDVSKRLPVSRQLKQPEDAATIADYGKPGFVLGDDWDPRAGAGSATRPADGR